MLIFAGIAPTLAGRWYEDYESAQRALTRSSYEEALRNARSASEQKPNPGINKPTYGTNAIDYFPYLMLGRAHFHLGNLEDADLNFQESRRRGVVLASDQSSELERYEALTRSRISEDETAFNARMANARQLLDDGRLEDAQGVLRDLVIFLETRSHLAGRRPQVEQQLEVVNVGLRQAQVDRANRDRAQSLTREGESLMNEGRYAEAAARATQALDLSPVPEAVSLRDEAARQLQLQVDEQRAEADRIRKLDECLQRIADAEQSGDLEGALSAVEEALSFAPEHPQAKVAGTRIRQELRRRDETALLEREVTNRLQNARAAHQNADFREAYRLAVKVLELDPAHDEAESIRSASLQRINLVDSGRGFQFPVIEFDARTDPESPLVSHSTELTITGSVRSGSPIKQLTLTANSPGSETLQYEVTSTDGGDGRFDTSFTIPVSLPDPEQVTTFAISVEDTDRFTASAKYFVVYIVPWFRRPEIWTAIVAATGLLTAIFLAVRAWSRAKTRRRGYNPYIVGNPITDRAMVFGRKELLNKVLLTIHNNSVMLAGERRIGKTTLLHQIKARLLELDDPEYSFYPILVDLEGVPEPEFFYQLGHQMAEDLSALVPGLASAAVEGNGHDYTMIQMKRDVRMALRALGERDERVAKIVFLIDEVDELNHYNHQTPQRMRNLFVGFPENLAAVFSGVEVVKKADDRVSPWYNFFEEWKVPPLASEDARQLVLDPIRGVYEFEDDAVSLIIEASELRPFKIQGVCRGLINRLHQQGRRTAGASDVAAVVEEIDVSGPEASA
ncbi:hypothetical protein N9971_00205 [bacterium]|nr:hypothetical protein [bacterium]